MQGALEAACVVAVPERKGKQAEPLGTPVRKRGEAIWPEKHPGLFRRRIQQILLSSVCSRSGDSKIKKTTFFFSIKDFPEGKGDLNSLGISKEVAKTQEKELTVLLPIHEKYHQPGNKKPHRLAITGYISLVGFVFFFIGFYTDFGETINFAGV